MKAKFVKEITVTDPDSKGEVSLSVYKHPHGGMFAIDSSYVEQCFDDDEKVLIPDPFETHSSDNLYNSVDWIELDEIVEDNEIREGDKFIYSHPKYKRPDSSIVGKVMIAETINENSIEPKSNDLTVRKYPKKYCTKV